MKRFLVAAFSVMFFLSAVFSAFCLSVDPRNANKDNARLAVTADMAGQALPIGTFHADTAPDAPTDNLLAAEPFVLLDGMQNHLHAWAWGQTRPHLGAHLAAPSVPWTYLKVLLRPPRLLA